ncbi:MAG: pyridoxal-phosphate dependent enzyme [Vicingaceae bacterium]|nr:pyridoxal-phosphate dependent enzyme [Vicingaceae bacterium]
MQYTNENNIPLTEVFDTCIRAKNSRLFILREDLIHPEISGNKWRKLKYNIAEAKSLNKKTLVTFGGAYSNHIAATAAAGKEFDLKTIGIIRGEEVLPLNSTLQLAKDNGMELNFISRGDYRVKDTSNYDGCYVIPEGGSNAFAVKGCTEIIEKLTVDYDVICSACGTGGTLAGIIASTEKQVIGFPALKGGNFLKEDIVSLLDEYANQFSVKGKNKKWDLATDYHFGGYAKVKPELIEFVKQFKGKHKIPLDLIYTGKMLFGIYDLLQNTNQLDGKTIIAIHTGGLQGNKGFEDRLGIVL